MSTSVTTTEILIAQTEETLAQLRAKKAAEDEARAIATPRVRELAVYLHRRLCPDTHGPLPGQCAWYLHDPRANDPGLADWTAERHLYWLGIAQAGVGLQIQLGWTVAEPGGDPGPGPEAHV